MSNRQNLYIVTGTSRKNFTKQTHPFGLTKSAKYSSVIIPNVPVNCEVNLSMYRDDGRVTAQTYVG
jgi:hypothetical protein